MTFPPSAFPPGSFAPMESSSPRMRVGCDLVELGEVEHSLSEFGDRYLRKMFTEAEQAASAGPNRLPRLAARFAAKEAVVKAFAAPDAAFPPHEIEVVLAGSVPSLRLTGATERLAAEQGWTDVSLSLSHTACHAMAVVFVLCDAASSIDGSEVSPS